MFLDDLTLFLRIVERGGMAAAGRDLGVSRTRVSERLVALEKYYGARLLARTTRSIHLTDEGRTLVEGARRILSEAEETRTRIRHGVETLSGTVRISATADLGRNRLGPVLDAFTAQHPNVTIDATFTDGHVDLIGLGIDLAIRLGPVPDSTMRARVVARNWRVVCAAPQYLEAHGTPRHPTDLIEHNCIVMRFGEEIDNHWPFVVAGKEIQTAVGGNRISNDGGYAKSLVLAGHGIALKSIWDVADELKSGALVQVLREFRAADTAIRIVYPNGAVQPRRVRALMDHIADWFAANQPES